MKKLATLLLVVIATSMIGCSSDDSGGNTEEGFYLKFTYSGKQYFFEPQTGTSLQTVIMGMEDVNDVQTRLSLYLPENPSVGTFEITNDTPTDQNLATVHNAILTVGDANYAATSGTLKITSLTEDIIKGTFSFTATDDNGVVVTVTNGSFTAFN